MRGLVGKALDEFDQAAGAALAARIVKVGGFCVVAAGWGV